MLSLLRKFFVRYPSRCRDSVSCIICGLGNTGVRYQDTRHNCGFMVVDALLQKGDIRANDDTLHAAVAIVRLPSGETIACAKPKTYVNRSGIAVASLLKRYAQPLSSCLIVCDDFNLPLGTLRLRRRGSDGGHNGLKSIIAETGEGFPRLRIGIGPIPESSNVIDFVLGRFNDREREKRDVTIGRAADAILLFCQKGIDAAMNSFNVLN